MSYCCEQDDRRDAVRSMTGRNGLDYVEVLDDQMTLYVYLLGKLPSQLSMKSPSLNGYFSISGGRRITGIKITSVTPVAVPDPEKDDYLVLTVDKFGDFSTYTLGVMGVENIDPRYSSVRFSFKVNCPSDLDCEATCDCEPPALDEPRINYLAKDYASFTQLILDRLALLMPGWTERHAPDIGMALVEVLAYTGDYLSYHQDAVATEAYLGTARQRISIRRHVRLVDYILHEGTNARAWVVVSVSQDIALASNEISFITGLNDALGPRTPVLTWENLVGVPTASYTVFEPMVAETGAEIQLYAVRNVIEFYTWGERECCLKRGSTSATVRDPGRALQLKPGDVLIFEEVLSSTTGLTYDADPKRRCAVRLTKVMEASDPVFPDSTGAPVTLLELEWGWEDKLPFPLCLSSIGPAPACEYMENVSVAHGNVVLVDHGQTLPPETLGQVPTLVGNACCDCGGQPSEVVVAAGKLAIKLASSPLTYAQTLATEGSEISSASALIKQDERLATPQIVLHSDPEKVWIAKYDLIESSPNDVNFVVEVDSEGYAHLRFGDGKLGFQPPAGMSFKGVYRVGNGTAGNVGAEAISRIVLRNLTLNGVDVSVRNPMPAEGGMDAEPVADAVMFAPTAFRKQLQRAVIAKDYETLAEKNKKLQRASAELEWNGSWYEADVAVDPLGTETPGKTFLKHIECSLEPYRRIGCDIDVTAARYVPLYLELEVCALPDYQRAHVKAALLGVFGSKRLPGGALGFFHPDNLSFGDPIFVSHLVAAGQIVDGVECVTVTALHRLFEPPNGELQKGVLALATDEIAQLDSDPNFPEHGVLKITVRGGR